jgi:phosphatidylinositol alpha-mannosyltransferase
VVGSGPQSQQLRSRRVPGVEWLGVVSDEELAARLRGAEVFCAPSVGSESFGMVLLEAMAAGCTIVESDIDGYRNVARPDREAVAVPPGDPVALRTALRAVLDDPSRRAAFVEAGRARAAEFSLRRLAEAYVEVYEKTLALA